MAQVAPALGISHGFQACEHRRVVVQRFAHPHEHDVPNRLHGTRVQQLL